MKKKSLLLMLTVFSLVLLAACGSVEVEYVTVSASRVDLIVGESETVTATVVPEGADQTVTWESANTDIATVDEGVITGVAQGATTVTVRAGEEVALIDVRVTTPPADDDDDDDDDADNGDEENLYLNGRYRGTYEDRGVQQVSIQFTLTDDIISSVSYRWLYHAGNDYRQMDESHALWDVKIQHDQIAEALEGMHISEIDILHTPEELADDFDAFAAATLRGNKIFSSMKDALNRGLYVPAEEGYSVDLGDFPDGRYRGTYGDRGDQQVSIQFTLTDNIISSVSYRWLYHAGNDYRQMDDTHALWDVKVQHDEIAEYLEGKDLSEIFKLHTPEVMANDYDTFAAATLRGNKIYSAMRDALNRGLYVPEDEGYTADLGQLEDGRYRGIYGDRGDQQVSIQFTLTDNIISSVSYRWLYHAGNDYRQMDDTHALWGVKIQHDEIAEYLEGKDISEIFKLHTPEVMANDYDTFAAATLRGNKIYSAMRDAINRGLYVPAS